MPAYVYVGPNAYAPEARLFAAGSSMQTTDVPSPGNLKDWVSNGLEWSDGTGGVGTTDLSWAPSTIYAVGKAVIAPDGNLVKALVAHASSTFYDAEKWIYPSDDGATVFDFTQLPDGDANTIRPTKGHLKSRSVSGGNIANLVVQGGRLTTINTHPNFYFEAGLIDSRYPIQHMWCIADIDPNPPVSTGITFVWPRIDQTSGIEAGIHWGFLLNTGGSFEGLWGSEGYNTAGQVANGPTHVPIQQPRGREMQWDIIVDRRTGQMTGYIDGIAVIQYTDIDVLNWIRHTGIIQFPGGWVKVREFGISPRLPLFHINSTGRNVKSDFNNFTALTTLSTTYQLAYSFPVSYGSGGAVLVEMPLWLQCTAGNIEVCLGTATVADDQSQGIPDRYATSPFDGRVHFSAPRRGTPGTSETVGIWIRLTAGGAGQNRNTQGNNGGGPRWHPMQIR